jgi:hypothetical protein
MLIVILTHKPINVISQPSPVLDFSGRPVIRDDQIFRLATKSNDHGSLTDIHKKLLLTLLEKSCKNHNIVDEKMCHIHKISYQFLHVVGPLFAP